MKNKKLLAKTCGILILFGGITAMGTLTLNSESIKKKEAQVTQHALTNPTLTANQISDYQTKIPSWAKSVQMTLGGKTVSTYSISELLLNKYKTYASFKKQFYEKDKLNFTKNSCNSVLKDSYKTTNNCAFFTSLLYMQEQNKELEKNNSKDLFIQTEGGVNNWVINPDFFKEDEDKTDNDNNYLVLNYLALKEKFGFKKEEVTAIPFQLAFSMKAKGAAAVDFSLTRFPVASPETNNAILNFASNPIITYPSTPLTTPRIELVDLSNTGLGKINASAWPTAFSNVINLNLKDNSIVSLPETLFPSLGNLKYLDISSSSGNITEKNKLTALPTNFSQVAPNIEYLNLSNNNFTSNPIQSHLRNLRKLRVLNLSGNPITSFGDFSQLAGSLTSLFLGKTNISSLGTSLNSLKNLELLSLKENSLSTFPEGLARRLPRLKHLDLSKNSITSLPNLATLPKLETLLLSENKNLTLGPQALAPLTKLKVLNLSSTKVDADKLNLSNNSLYQVSFNNLGLKAIPASLFSIVSLELVSLAENKITELKLSPYWRRVNFYKNKIKTISTFSMPQLDALKKPKDSLSYIDWTNNLEAIIFDFSNLDWQKMSDPRILKVRIPLFWDLGRISRFYTAVPYGMVTRPINEILKIENLDRSKLQDILPTTLEFELLAPTVKAELNLLNKANNTNYSYADISDTKLVYSFSRLYKGPENFSSINAFTTALQASTKLAYENLRLLKINDKLKRAVAKKNNEATDASNIDRNVVILIVVAIMFAIFFTTGSLLIMLNRGKKLLGEVKK